MANFAGMGKKRSPPASALPELSGETAATPSLASVPGICRLIVDCDASRCLLKAACSRSPKKGLQLL